MEKFKNHIGHFALPTLLVLIISAGVWAFLEFSNTRHSFRSAEGESNIRSGRKPRETAGQSLLDNPPRQTFRPALNISREFNQPEAVQKTSPQDLARASRPPLVERPSNDTSKSVPDSVKQSAIKIGGQDTVKTPTAHQTADTVKSRNDSSLTIPKSIITGDTLSAGNKTGTTSAKSDTTAQDSLKLSAWLQGVRKDHAEAQIFPEYHYPLFLYSNIIQRSATIDSTGDYVDIRETLWGNDVKVPLEVPLKEYIKLEERYSVQKTWEDLAHAYTLNNQQDQLGSLMQGVTNIDIPIPPNPVLSIFGPPRINLKISGAVDIRGAWRNQKINAQTLSQLGNVTNQPDFQQDVQINVNGTVGDKLNIGANWDTQNQFEYENQLKIKYTGYDDEIVKSVEAGNVSLSTPSSFIGSSQALFGIKSQMQLGPLTLTALASQQKAQGKTLTVSGGSQSQTFKLHAYDFATNHFFIDSRYLPGYEQYYQQPGQPYNSDLLITDYEVYVSVPTATQDPTIRDGVAVMELPPREANRSFYDSLRAQTGINTPNPGLIDAGRFKKLANDQFTLDPKTGVLTLNNQILPEQIIAVAYKTQDDSTFGTFSYADTSKSRLVLKLVKPPNLIPSYTEAWQLQLRNIYPTGGLNLDLNSLKDVKIMYQLPGQTAQDNIQGYSLLQVFGVDKTGAGGSGPPDGVFDWNPGVDINPMTGEIIFPFLRPFDEAFKQYKSSTGQQIASPDSFAYRSVYDTTMEAAMNDAIHDRFLITGSYTSSVSSHYNLGFNLVQGSVKVLLNGNPLTPDVDYTVDYLSGEVNIRNQAALVPGANVQIQYETNDIFQIASKSLVGTRADLKVNDQTNFGFTLMNFSQQSPNNKVRLGEEPISNLILGVDGGTTVNLPFLTRALDALPLIQTAAPSSISIHGEAAYMLPNPNTRTSPIPDDHGQGIAYIDDFEGAKRTIPIGVNYSGWTLASPPAVSALDSVYNGIQDSSKTDFKGWTYWYNIIPSDVSVKTIWPQKNVPQDQQSQTVMNVAFEPTVRGQYNRSHNIDSTLKSDPKLAWGGMMKVLSSNASDLTTQNINYIEIWMQIVQAPGDGTMHIDLGQVSEDIFGDRVLHTEDPSGLGTLQPQNDLGLDGINDAQEQAKYPWIKDRPPLPNGNIDPDGDDYYYNLGSSDYTHVNGTEGNSVTEAGRLPDTEDLNHNGVLDLSNNYFEYSVKLDTTNNPYITGGGSKGWYQFIIPLNDYKRAVGNPSLSVVQYVRVWFNGMTGPMLVRIAEMNLIGNYWRTPNQNDTTMQVSVVNVEDNPDYTPPVPGLRPVDNSNPNGPILLNEQSLALILNGLKDGDSRYVFKTFPQPLNVFHYHTMKFFAHGDSRFNYVDSTNYDADVFIRFGSDSLDFYEYRQPLKVGWQDITVDFAKLTAIKQARDSVTAIIPRRPADNGVPGATYWILGNPSLQSVSYFQIGIKNPANTGTSLPLYGTVWIDELRLADVDNTPGFAYRFDTNIQLADIGSLAFNFSRVDPYFHGLTTQFGSQSASQNWGISGSFSLDKLLPREWQGTTIPFTYTHSEGFSNPLYLPNSDIVVAEAVRNRQSYLISKGMSPNSAAAAADSLLVSSQVLRVADSWAVPNMRIVIPSTKWYVRDILDNITMGFNWTGSRYHDTQIKSGNQWAWNFSSGYSIQFDPMAYFTPFPSKKTTQLGNPSAGSRPESGQDFQIRYLPNSLSFSMNAGRSLTIEKLWTQSTLRTTPNFMAQRSGAINWRLTNNGFLNPTIDYRFNVSSSLLYLETDQNGNPLPDSYVFRQIFVNNGLVNFGRDYDFSEQFSLTTQPKLPFNLQQYIDLQGSYNSAYRWSNSIQQGAFGRGAGFNASLQLGSTVRVKMLTDPWFASAPEQQQQQTNTRGHGREEFAAPDTTQTGKKGNSLGNLLKVLIKVPFLDFDNVSFNFSSTNSSQNGGLPTFRPGMGNFFRVPFIQASNPELGPSQLYQLGLVSDPYSRLTFIKKNGFPFFGFETTQSSRIPKANITDNFANNNSLDIKTSRNLWQGARIDLSWHIGWSYNRNMTFSTDSLGNPRPNTESVLVTGQINRSFFTLPPVFVFSMFKSGISQVAVDYQNLKSDPTDTRTDDQKLSQAFVQGFETLPFLDKIFGQYMPRLNYSFHWDGLEQLPLFKNFAQHVSLDHSYQSNYSQSWHSTNGGSTITDAQEVSYGFQPLVGINIAFKNIGDATISGSVLYNTNTEYSLSPSARTIAQAYTGQLTVSANYAKRGFSIPFFGLNLKNDVDVSASFSSSQTSRVSFNSDNISSGGTPIDGVTQTSLELRFKYVVSQRVTASVYYRNTRVVPSIPGSLVPGTTTNEAGVDVHVSIAG